MKKINMLPVRAYCGSKVTGKQTSFSNSVIMLCVSGKVVLLIFSLLCGGRVSAQDETGELNIYLAPW